uniref:MSP domain-containing protein n=1 Tax=Syphacia muris TaxID=451379 RepID=A0A0N5AGY1_9BILA
MEEAAKEEFLDLLLPADEADFDNSLVGEECPFNCDFFKLRKLVLNFVVDDESCKEFVSDVSAKKNRGVSHMSTIAEESQILDEMVSEANIPGSSKGDGGVIPTESSPRLAENLESQKSETFLSDEFVRGGGIQMQKHEESYLKSRAIYRDDYRFNKSHQEKENSWEPSIHESALPLPVIQETMLREKLNTNSHISVSDDSTGINESRSNKVAKPKDSNSKCDSSAHKISLSDAEPKISTPNAESKSKRERLRNITLNFEDISAILPVNNGVACRNEKCSEHLKNFAQECPQNDVLSYSAINDAIANAGMNDTALLNALFKAKFKFKEHSLKGMVAMLQKNRSFAELPEKPVKNVRITSDLKDTERGVSEKQLRDRNCYSNKDDNSASAKNLGQLQTSENLAPSSAGPSRCVASSVINRESFSYPVSERSRAAVLTFKPAFLYFGFVELDTKMNGFIRLRNKSTSTVNLKFSLKSNKGFKLVDQGIVILRPNETYSVHIIFQPVQAAYYRNILRISVLNADHLRYSVPLEGSGGAASLEVRQRDGINMVRDGSIVVKMQGQTSVLFDLENKGIRDAFVRVIVKDKTGKIMERVQVFPSDFAVVLRHRIQRFEINLADELPSNYSSASMSYASSHFTHSFNPEYFVQLLWGQEGQRRKLKKFEELKGTDVLVADLSFTNRKAYNEEASKKTSAEKSMVGDFDLETFESGLRIISISIVDNRFLMSAGRLSEHPISESVMLNPDETLASTFSNITVCQDVSTLEN